MNLVVDLVQNKSIRPRYKAVVLHRIPSLMLQKKILNIVRITPKIG